MLTFALLALVALASASSERASASLPLPLAKQKLGYQFYAALPIAADLHKFLIEHYTLLAEVQSGARPTQTTTNSRHEAELSVSHALFDSIARRNYDNARAAAQEDCAERAAALADECTTSRFSPFELVCELTVVVDTACHKRRAVDDQRYNSALRALIEAENVPDALCNGADVEQVANAAASNVVPPAPQQAYNEYAERRTALRAAARRLSRAH